MTSKGGVEVLSEYCLGIKNNVVILNIIIGLIIYVCIYNVLAGDFSVSLQQLFNSAASWYDPKCSGQH